jgi:hypothetical protein
VLKDLIIEEKSKFVSLDKGRGSEAEEGFVSEIRIFTLVSDTDTLTVNHSPLSVTTALPSRLNRFFLYCTSKKIPVLSSLFDYRNLIIFAPRLMKILSRKIQKYHPDAIHISSFAIAKNIDQCKNNNRSPLSVSRSLYLHSPMQYIRSHYEEYTQKLK